MAGPAPADDTLQRVLAEARDLGFLGPGPVGPHLDHARAMAAAVEPDVPGRAADLGTGGGVPGLVLALRWAGTSFLLVEAMRRRADFLAAAVEHLDLVDRVTVTSERAESLGRDPAHRAGYDLVTARSFGPPPVTAECAAPLLRAGGRLVTSEPPAGPGPDRWPTAGLALLGMSLAGVRRGDYSFAVLRQDVRCPERYPRRVGVPAKRPLF